MRPYHQTPQSVQGLAPHQRHRLTGRNRPPGPFGLPAPRLNIVQQQFRVCGGLYLRLPVPTVGQSHAQACQPDRQTSSYGVHKCEWGDSGGAVGGGGSEGTEELLSGGQAVLCGDRVQHQVRLRQESSGVPNRLT